jgi:hypothetical protein
MVALFPPTCTRLLTFPLNLILYLSEAPLYTPPLLNSGGSALTWLKIGQTFMADNRDYNVLEDEWTIVGIDYPSVTFSNKKHWVRDIAYTLPFSTDTVVGIVERETDTMAIIALQFTRFSCEAGILLKEKQASYLKSLDPIIYL